MKKKVAVILTGGRSSRFGRDKAQTLWQGRTLLDWAIHHAKQAGFQVIIRDGPSDPYPFQGPLQALFGIFQGRCFSRILLLACDMPLLEPTLLRQLWEKGRHADVTLLHTPGRLHPLPGVYSKKAGDLAERLFAQGRRDLKSLLKGNLTVQKIECKPSQKLANLNRPRDLENLSNLLI